MTTTTTRRPAVGGTGARPLRTALRIDGWSTGAFGVVLLAAGAWLSGPLGLPLSWSVPFGVAMLGGAAALGLIAGYPRIPERLVLAVVAGNMLSGAALLVIMAAGLAPLTPLGIAFLAVGALVVAAFAELEYTALRRARAAVGTPKAAAADPA